MPNHFASENINNVVNNNNPPNQPPTPPPHQNDFIMSQGILFRQPVQIPPPAGINLVIYTQLNIHGDNNIIAYDPSQSAQQIILAVVSTIRQLAPGAGGPPMVDENGRPREINITVHAETNLEGSKNLIGEKGLLAAKMGVKAQPPKTVKLEKEELAENGQRIKREREEESGLFVGAEISKKRRT